MQYTSNLNLKKPDTTDYVNVSDLNDNMDIIDQTITEISDSSSGIEQQLAEHLAEKSHVHWIGTATGTNTLTATFSEITAYEDGLGVSFKNTTNSNAATSLNINGLGAIPILKANGSAVSNLKANGVYTLRYVSGNFILQGEGGSGNATASDLLSGKTASTDAGDIVGTMPNRGTFNLGLGASVPAGYYSGGTTANGKRWVSGTDTAPLSPSYSFTTADGGYVGLPALTVTFNFGFTPNLIIAVSQDGAHRIFYKRNAAYIGYDVSIWCHSSGNNSRSIRITGDSYVTASGFRLGFLNSSGVNDVFNWFAYE